MTQERKRELAPRSLVLSLLLGMRRPRRRGSELVAWCGLFGVAEGTARVALSRMVRAGELANESGVYALSGRLQARRAEQEFAIAPRFVDDGGEWTMHVVIAEGRPAVERSALRVALRHSRFAERRPAVWLRPANLAQRDAELVTANCEMYRVRPAAPRSLAGTLFAPEQWAGTARALRDGLRRSQAGLPAAEAIAPAFLAGTRVAAHLRADPLLPDALVPARWPGAGLRADYLEYQDGFAHAVRQWFATVADDPGR